MSCCGVSVPSSQRSSKGVWNPGCLLLIIKGFSKNWRPVFFFSCEAQSNSLGCWVVILTMIPFSLAYLDLNSHLELSSMTIYGSLALEGSCVGCLWSSIFLFWLENAKSCPLSVGPDSLLTCVPLGWGSTRAVKYQKETLKDEKKVLQNVYNTCLYSFHKNAVIQGSCRSNKV